MDNICRLCLSGSEKMASKIDNRKETKLLEDLYRLNIQIMINKLLPTSVCNKCVETVESMLHFRDFVLTNQNKLLDMLEIEKQLHDFNEQTLVDIPKENMKIEKDIDVEDSICNEEDYNAQSKMASENKSDPESRNKIIRGHHKRKKLGTRKDRYQKSTNKNNLEISINMGANESLTFIKQEEEFSDVENIMLNTNKEVNFNDHQCLTCFISLTSKKELINHYKTAHIECKSKNTETNCIESSLESNKDETQDEIKTILDESSRLYVCKLCGRTFSCVNSIIRHSRAHSSSVLYCSHNCGYNTVYRGALRDHERRHDKDYKYRCSTCGTGFHVKTWHDQHQNLHKNLKPFVCDICGMTFHMDRYLTSHRSAVHSDVVKGVKNYMCLHCDGVFYNMKRYKKHLEEHEGKKRFLCDVCGKECSTSELLKHHKNTHLGLKTYSCSICSKTFAKKYNLKTHSLAHAGVKHLCNVCGNHFAQRSTLLRHMRKFHSDLKHFNDETEENAKTIEKGK